MPARGGVGAAVATDVVLLLGGGHLGSFARIEAHGDYVEFIADIELYQAHGAGESGQSLAAQHGAVVINQVEDQGLVAEIVAQLHGLAGFVAEGEIGRDLRVEMLLDADVLEPRRARVRRRRHYAVVHLCPGGRCQQPREPARLARRTSNCWSCSHHFFAPFLLIVVVVALLGAGASPAMFCARTGSPRCTSQIHGAIDGDAHRAGFFIDPAVAVERFLFLRNGSR